MKDKLYNRPCRVLRLVYNKMTVTLDADTINYIKLLEYEGDDGKASRFEFYNTADGHIASYTPSANLGLDGIQRLYDEVCLLVLFTRDDFYATLTKEQLLKCPKY